MSNSVTHIQLDTGSWNGSRMIYHECEVIEKHPLPGRRGKFEEHRCGADSTFLVTYKGGFSGNQFNMHLCYRHAKYIVGPNEKQPPVRNWPPEGPFEHILLEEWIRSVENGLADNIGGYRCITRPDALQSMWVKVIGMEEGV